MYWTHVFVLYRTYVVDTQHILISVHFWDIVLFALPDWHDRNHNDGTSGGTHEGPRSYYNSWTSDTQPGRENTITMFVFIQNNYKNISHFL